VADWEGVREGMAGDRLAVGILDRGFESLLLSSEKHVFYELLMIFLLYFIH
jgi:hypothetical protein